MNGPGRSREQLVSEAFVALADTLVTGYDVIDLLDRLVGYSVQLLAADAAGIMLGDAGRELQVVAGSSGHPKFLELMQLQSGQGPCLDCYLSGTPVAVPDLSDVAARWPQFAAAAAKQGAYRSVHAVPMRLRGQAIGALNLFNQRAGPLPAADLALAQALADVATIGILHERAIRHHEVLAGQLQSALTSRIVIEQAKGLLAQNATLDMDTAFDRMRGYSRSYGLRLAEVARRLVQRELDPAEVTGLLPPRSR